MKIALDAMGGDYAPKEIVRGAILAAAELQVEIALVGNRHLIAKELAGSNGDGLITITHAPEVIGMDEHPVSAVRRKRNASIVVCNAMVKEGLADAVVSAGNTGAAMASSLFSLGRIKGIARPAIGSVLPTLKGALILTDAGANVECKPHHLQQFAVMASIYAEKALGIDSPKLGLVNIGSEAGKGSELTQTAYKLLEETAGINFCGNIEGKDLMMGDVQVAVCDGFVGNVVLKTAEGTAMFVLGITQKELAPLAAEINPGTLTTAFKNIKRQIDYSEYGGAPLLGINGVSIISHGSSNAYAIRNAIKVARDSVNKKLVDAISMSIAQMGEENK